MTTVEKLIEYLKTLPPTCEVNVLGTIPETDEDYEHIGFVPLVINENSYFVDLRELASLKPDEELFNKTFLQLGAHPREIG